MDSPKVDYMPSFIEGLKNNYRLDNLDPLSAAEILEIEQNPEDFFQKFVTQKTTPISSPSNPDAPSVPRSEFWYVDGNTYIGRVNIRHALNDELLVRVGNIGFEVVPAQQRKGHATVILQWALNFCRENTDLRKVLLTTADTNTASVNLIEKNGGIMENKVERPDSNTLTRRYWISL